MKKNHVVVFACTFGFGISSCNLAQLVPQNSGSASPLPQGEAPASPSQAPTAQPTRTPTPSPRPAPSGFGETGKAGFWYLHIPRGILTQGGVGMPRATNVGYSHERGQLMAEFTHVSHAAYFASLCSSCLRGGLAATFTYDIATSQWSYLAPGKRAWINYESTYQPYSRIEYMNAVQSPYLRFAGYDYTKRVFQLTMPRYDNSTHPITVSARIPDQFQAVSVKPVRELAHEDFTTVATLGVDGTLYLMAHDTRADAVFPNIMLWGKNGELDHVAKVDWFVNATPPLRVVYIPGSKPEDDLIAWFNEYTLIMAPVYAAHGWGSKTL